MYVCMYRGCPSWNCPWNRAIQLGLGEGPIRIVGPISQPRSIIYTASRTLDHTRALYVRFLNQLYSRQLPKDVLHPHVGGTVTHRAREFGTCETKRSSNSCYLFHSGKWHLAFFSVGN